MQQKYIILLFMFCFPVLLWGQLPAVQKNKVGFKKEVYGGVTMHTSGFGATLSYSKFITYKKKRLLSMDIVSMKHSKEIKIKSFIDQNSKDFVYGKLNGVVFVRPGYGQKYLWYEKLRDKGVNISWHWTLGPSFAFLKPMYLDVANILPDGSAATPKQEAYDPEFHNLSNIYGKSKGILGLAETKIVPGGFFKMGLEFEYNDNREIIRAIETGFVIDVFPKKLEIMTYTDNAFIYPTLYINILIGKRFF